MKRLDWVECLLALGEALSIGFGMGYIVVDGVSAFLNWHMWLVTAPGLAIFWYKVRRHRA